MRKQLMKWLALGFVLTLTVVFCLTACDSETENPPATTPEAETTQPATSAPATSAPVTTAATTDELSEYIKSLQIASDDTGIYATVLYLSDKIADKGAIEMIYYGPKGTYDENNVVATFHADYEKNTYGTYDVNTYLNGMVNYNQHGKTEIKLNNTFGALIRAGQVILTYTPDGGETVELIRLDAVNCILRH